MNSLSSSARVQRYAVPLVEKAPAKRPDASQVIGIEDFIKFVEAEEKRVPLAKRANTKDMITRLRKVFYDRPGWDKYLIPGAKSVPAPYTTRSTERKGRTLKTERITPEGVPASYSTATVVRTDYQVTDSKDTTPSLYKQQEIRLKDGSYIDMGHVFAGLDALNYPSHAGVKHVLSTDDNAAAVTWLGDLASVAGEMFIKILALTQGDPRLRQPSRPLQEAEKQSVVDEFAPARDMLGNIDGYVISDAYRGRVSKKSGGELVSSILRHYYLGGRDVKGVEMQSHRFSRFALIVGLGTLLAGMFTNAAAWLKKYTAQLRDLTEMYLAVSLKGSGFLQNKLGVLFRGGVAAKAASALQKGGSLKRLLKRFLDGLRRRVRGEP